MNDTAREIVRALILIGFGFALALACLDRPAKQNGVTVRLDTAAVTVVPPPTSDDPSRYGLKLIRTTKADGTVTDHAPRSSRPVWMFVFWPPDGGPSTTYFFQAPD